LLKMSSSLSNTITSALNTFAASMPRCRRRRRSSSSSPFALKLIDFE